MLRRSVEAEPLVDFPVAVVEAVGLEDRERRMITGDVEGGGDRAAEHEQRGLYLVDGAAAIDGIALPAEHLAVLTPGAGNAAISMTWPASLSVKCP